MSEILLEAQSLIKHFPARGGVVRAVDGVDLSLLRGETLGLVGESGCGKSTLARLLMLLMTPNGGQIRLNGQPIVNGPDFRRRVQIVFQDPYRSLNPRRSAGAAVAEPLLIHGLATKADAPQKVARLLEEVGLDAGAMHRLPHEFSGGQRQRIGIARALASQPELVVLDEPVSALDVSVQAQIVHLLQGLQKQRGLTFLFISHNLGVVRHMAGRVAVMYLGKIVETAPVRDLYAAPRHPYTRALLEAVPEPDPELQLTPQLRGDAPDPSHVPPGCRFHPRCQLARQVAAASDEPKTNDTGDAALPIVCVRDEPALREVATNHRAACHFAERLGELANSGNDQVARGGSKG